MGAKKCECVDLGFGYGYSEWEVRFKLAPRNGDLSASIPETPEPLALRSGPELGPGLKFELSANLGSVGQNFVGSGAYTQR